ncbi:hypothetical protein G7B40_034290 [Aetokthonos hydrillicola Thurmond2011]|uniref:EF-hand domain-containing protein n=1 Tax=Aetokthonos hydrillicola Thurmond2011 TaxID=2712845 RepID=A0AAP5IDG6_9CYAN|nr:hypothetical protein [Aetokthonos hydrillicola Thurmond2011]
MDHDGDGSINFEEFCKLIPEESETNIGYKDSPILQISLFGYLVSTDSS